MTPPVPPRQSTAIEAVADSVIMKLFGVGFALLGSYLLVKETVPMPNAATPRQSTVAISIFAGIVVLGAAMAIGSRFIAMVTALGSAVGKYLPWRKGTDT